MPTRLLAGVTTLMLVACAGGSAADTTLPSHCAGQANLALDRPATASSGEPALAFDGDPGTRWEADSAGEQWIEVDLGELDDVTCIRLLPGWSHGPETSHRVNAGVHDNPGAVRGTLSSGATEGDWLLLEGRWNVQFLRVTTLDSSVAPVWHEIEVFGG